MYGVYVVYSLEIVAVILGLIYYKKYIGTSTKYFIWFLFYGVILEFILRYPELLNENYLKLLEGTVFHKIYWIYNLLWTIACPLFVIFYSYKSTQLVGFKKNIFYVGIAYFVIAIGYYLFHWSELGTGVLPVLEFLGFGIVLFIAVFYYIELLIANNVIVFYRSVRFYVLTAILIWWFTITPITFFDLFYLKTDESFLLLRDKIYLFGNLIVYPMFFIGLIVSKPEKVKL